MMMNPSPRRSDVTRRSHGNRMKQRPRTRHTTFPQLQETKNVSTERQKKDTVRIVPLGGFEEIGGNMTVIEYDGDIVIVDMGLQMPSEEMHGIDYIIPNTTYLEGRERDIKGVFFTHGHLDHIGAVPHISPKLGNPTLYAADLAAALIRKKMEDHQNAPKQNIQVVTKNTKVNLGKMQVEFFHITHSFPNALGVFVKTPAGNVVVTGDFKIDLSPISDEQIDFVRLAEISKQGVTVMMSDSTGATREGYAMSESDISKDLEEVFTKTKGRIIVGTFASLISRIQQITKLAEKLNRRIVVEGYSMRTNVEIAQKMGYLKTREKIFITAEESLRLPDNRVIILSTGAQGEGNAALMRITSGEHRSLKIHKGDTIIFSSSVIPGNERTIAALMDSLYKQGAEVVNYNMMDVHAGGHGHSGDLKLMLSIMRPKFFVPSHGTYHMLKSHAGLAHSLGMSPENTRVVTNGAIIEANRNEIQVLKKPAPCGYVMVDGLGVGDIGNVVLRDRQMMAEDGMFTIVTVIDGKKGEVVGSPDIISRGFIYMKESKEILFEVRKKVKQIVKEKAEKDHTTNFNYIKDNIRDKIGQYLFDKTQRRPMVLPVIIEV